MTDEEKAEEYFEKNRIINCMPYDNKESYIKAYLDGLTEGKPKWHDLRKNPDDLPKKDGTYLVSILLSNQIVTDTHEYRDGYFSKYLRIIAWCELPKFEE